jgi:hypothetical protein
MRWLTAPEIVWLTQALLVALALGLAASFIVGALLLSRPRVLFAVNRSLSRWIDTTYIIRYLEQPRTLERHFYRHHRLLGSAIVLGAGYVLLRWALVYDAAAFLAALDIQGARQLDWLVRALEFIVVLVHALALGLGAVILVRPSLLKALEHKANRWHTGFSLEKLDAVVGTLDTGFAVYPRLSGLLLVLATGWSLAALGPVIMQVLGR